MPVPIGKLAQKAAKLRTKRNPTMVTLHWTEWPNGKPDVQDDTAGNYTIGTGETKLPEDASATVRAFVHFVSPATSTHRVHSEVEAGDAIVDFALDLIRVTDPGDAAFTEDQVVDQVAFSQANLGVEESATGETIDVNSLENLWLEFGGHQWVQKEAGQELHAIWDTTYGGFNINRAVLVTRK